MFHNESDDIKSYLVDHHIDKLYHFTDRSNLLSIIKNGGLYSWYYCEQNNISINRPGGDHSSRDLDRYKGYQDYVRLSFCQDHPMKYVAKKEGRISEPIVIEISIDVCCLSDTLFSDRNATANDARIGGSIDALRQVDTNIVHLKYINLLDEQKPKYQAEVLVKRTIPLEFFINYQEIESLLTQKEKEELKQWQSKLREEEIADIRKKLPIPVIKLLEQDEVNYNDQKIKIRWRVDNATRIFINKQEYFGRGSSRELAAGTNRCCLYAINEIKYKDGTYIQKEAAKTIYLRQYPIPIINVSSSTSLIKLGQENEVLISWQLSNVKSAQIYIGEAGKDLNNLAKGSQQLILADKTIVYIKAVGLDGKRVFDSNRIYINAKNEAVIHLFTSDKLYSITDVPFMISWAVIDANKVYIKANNNIIADNLALSGKGQYILNAKTVLTICAEDDFGIKQQSIDLDVMPKPYIRFISIPMLEIENNINMRISLTRSTPSVKFPSIISIETATFTSTKLKTNEIHKRRIEVNEHMVSCLIQQSMDLSASRSHKLATLIANIKNIAQRIMKTI